MEVAPLVFEPWLELAIEIGGDEVLGLSLGAAGEAVVLTDPLRRSTVGNGSGSSERGGYCAVLHDGWSTSSIPLESELTTPLVAQPMPKGELLVVAARSERSASGEAEPNARIYDLDGALIRDFTLGDGIEDVQATVAGEIWTSYFDQGIIGGNGWGNDRIGEPGLIRWDRSGERLYRYDPPSGLDRMVDCYALNAVSVAVTWCYYYTEFALVRIEADRVTGFWESPIRGAHGFAVWRDRVLLCGSYAQQDLLHLLDLDHGNTARHTRSFRPVTPDGSPLGPCTARGDRLVALKDGALYRYEMRNLHSER